jgi:hypothetical protein
MKFATGDFIIVKPPVGKPVLLRGKEYDKKASTGYIESSLYDAEGTPTTMTFEAREVVANLGKRPTTGTAFGVKVEPFIKAHDTNSFGRVLQFIEMPEEFEKRLLKRGFKCWKQMKERGLGDIKFQLEFRPKKGKWAGTYYPRRAPLPVMDIRPDVQWSDMDIDLVYYHEMGHAVYFQKLSEKGRTRWVNKYHDLVTIREAGNQELLTMRQDLVDHGDVKTFAKELDDEGKETFKSVLKYIKNVHKLTAQQINGMIHTGDEIKHLWPDITHMGTPEVYLTEYATVDAEELAAEAFSLYMVGKKIPADLKVLIEKTFLR